MFVDGRDERDVGDQRDVLNECDEQVVENKRDVRKGTSWKRCGCKGGGRCEVALHVETITK